MKNRLLRWEVATGAVYERCMEHTFPNDLYWFCEMYLLAEKILSRPMEVDVCMKTVSS